MINGFREKALENLQCAERAQLDLCFDVAASRAYYAAYLGGKYLYGRDRGFNTDFNLDHPDLGKEIERYFGIEAGKDLYFARRLRRKADYYLAKVDVKDSVRNLAGVKELLRKIDEKTREIRK